LMQADLRREPGFEAIDSAIAGGRNADESPTGSRAVLAKTAGRGLDLDPAYNQLGSGGETRLHARIVLGSMSPELGLMRSRLDWR
jgi:hypothetical protein